MRGGWGRSLSLVLLLVLGVCIGGPALDPTFELPPQHFDGDADDPGHVGEVFVHWVDATVTDVLVFVPLPPTRHAPPSEVPPPKRVSLEPRGSRAPPA
jgi:hypothetical protein